MSTYQVPQTKTPLKASQNEIYLVASGDLRLSANQICWPAQADMEQKICDAFAEEGLTIKRAHPYDESLKHGFIWNQRMGMDIFKTIPTDAPLVVAVAVWQYSYHVLAGLRDHRGPILTIANWSGEWPGLVGMLNLNGALAMDLKHNKAILGIFDEGCMGMYNAIIDDELLNPSGIYKERLSQSALLAAMQTVTDEEANQARTWLDQKGMTFHTGTDEASELTDRQIKEQLKMYIAAIRIAHFFGCDAIGIQYQQGLKDMAPASDLAEGLLNNVVRPPVFLPDTGEELFAGKALPHFNEVDECAAVDALVTNRVWTAMSLDPATTLHDIRWGKQYSDSGIDDFIWVFEISGAVPPSHLVNGFAGAMSERQPAMYFPKGGGTIKGESKPGEIVWSRIYVMGGKLHCDLGRGTVVGLPAEEMKFRWESTTPQWPIMSAVLHGVTRDQLMGRHKANHIQVAYVTSADLADKALAVKAAMLSEMGIAVHICGNVNVG